MIQKFANSRCLFPYDVGMLLVHLAGLEGFEYVPVGRTHPVKEESLEKRHLVDPDVCHQSLGASVEHCHLLSHRHRAVLFLDEQTLVLPSLIEGHCGNLVHIG